MLSRDVFVVRQAGIVNWGVRFCTILLAALIGLSTLPAVNAETVHPKPLHKVKKHPNNYHGKKPQKSKYKPAKFKAPKLKKPKKAKPTSTTRKI